MSPIHDHAGSSCWVKGLQGQLREVRYEYRTADDQVIPPIGAEGLNRRPPVGACRLFLGPGFRLGARWNRLVETVKTRKKREFSGKNGRDTA